MQAFRDVFNAHRGRASYAFATAIWIETSCMWAYQLGEHPVRGGTAVGTFAAAHVGLTLTTAAVSLLWPFIAWQRLNSIGVQKRAAALCLAALVASWGWVVASHAQGVLAFSAFLAAQLPMLLTPGKDGQQGRAGRA